MVKSIFGGLLMSAVVFLVFSHSASAAKINLTPSNIILTEGQSQQVNLTLNEPIVCMEADPCQVSVDVSTDSPTRATIDTSPVIVSSNQWSQVFSFILTAVDDDLYNGDITPTVTIHTFSGSEYYDGFSPTFSLRLLDNDQPVQQDNGDDQDVGIDSSASESKNTPTLAGTGQSKTAILLAGISLVLASLSFSAKKLTR